MQKYLVPILLLILSVTNLRAQYCTTSLYGNGCANNYIKSVSTSGGIGNIVNLASGCSGSQSYIYYSNQTHIAAAGSSVGFKVVNNPSNYQNYKIWVDWDNNNSFLDPGELVYTGFIPQGDSATSSFLIPAATTTGIKRMRVRCSYYNNTFTPCSYETYGEVEDYNLSVISPTPCTPVPVAGTAISSIPSACPINSFSISLNGYIISAGSTVQWQSKLASSSTWTNIAGATNTIHYISGQSAATDYRAYIVCSTSSDTSSVISVLQNPFTQCYCSPNNGTPLINWSGNYIQNVSIPSTTLNYSTNTIAPNGYTQISPAASNGTATLIPGDLYTFSATVLSWTNSVGLWFDFNQNGIFDATEKIPVTINGTLASTSFVVPYTAVPGQTAMRVFASDYLTVVDPCVLQSDGEVEDYTITIMAIPACSGTPSAGLASAPANICPNTAFNLSLIGSSVASGLTYQWQAKPSTASVWTNITGANTKTISMVSQSSTTSYRAVVSCGSNSDTSAIATVNQNSITQCYCSPNNGTTLVSYAYNYVTNVSILNTTLNSSSSSVPGNGYTLVAATPASNTATLNPGNLYVFNASITSNAYGMGLWIDYNQNGLFEVTEKIPVTVNTNAGTATASFVVPTTATAGITGMRVTSSSSSTVNLPCGSVYNGEVEDYTINIVTLPACSGTPTPGVAAASLTSVCPTTSFLLSVIGHSAVSGLGFQWQSRPATSGTWTNILGATSKYHTINSQTNATDYRAVVTCGTSSDTTTIVSVAQNSLVLCYCGPNNGLTFTSTGTNLVTNAKILGTGLNVSSVSAPANGYTLVPITPSSNTATLVPGQSYMFEATFNPTLNYMRVWIDYNRNGVFEVSTEAVTLTFNTANNTATASFTVPTTAVAGITGMRIMSTTNYIYNPCDLVYNGEVEDYSITIAPSALCTGTPVGGAAGSTLSSVCPNNTFTLYLNGSSAASGLSYQWQARASSSGTWTNVAGATGKYYTVTNQSTATDYRSIVFCSSTADTSALVSVAQNSFVQCYCSPVNGVTLVNSSNNYITNVSIPATTLNASSWTTPLNGYTVFPATSSFNTAILNPGQNYSFTATLSTQVYSLAIWIDYNQSGSFDPSEKTTAVINTNNTATANLMVPANALPGATGMRVAVDYGSTITSSCTTIWGGEVEDYTVTVVTLPVCSGNPVAGSASSTLSSVCANTPFALYLSGTSAASGLTFQWQSKPATSSTWTNLSGATTKYYTITSQSTATDYRAVVTCLSSSDTSGIVSVAQNSYAVCYCSPLNGSTLVSYASNYISNVSILATTLNSSSWSTNMNGYTQYPPSLSYNTATLTTGQSYTFNATLYSSWTYAALWIDFNQSGTFDPSEKIALTITSNLASATFTVPASATAGQVGLRISTSDNGIFDPCIVINYGEVEDYTLTIKAACTAPTLLTPTQITSSSATLNWNAVAGALNYEYVIDQNGNNPTGSGTATTNLSHTEPGLNAAESYYFHIRTNCGNNDYSPWSAQFFSTYPTSINSVNNGKSMLEVFPNPAREKVTVRLTDKSILGGTISILDIHGKVINTVSVLKQETVLDLNSLSQGVYLIRYNNTRYSETIRINKL